MMNKFSRKIRIQGWEKMNRSAADDVCLTASERGILTRILTRLADHYFSVEYLCGRMGISDSTWEKTSWKFKELGYLKYNKTRGAREFDHTYEFSDTPSVPAQQRRDGFEAALRLVKDEIEEFKLMANGKRSNSITKYHWQKNCLSQLRQVFESGGVEGLRAGASALGLYTR